MEIQILESVSLDSGCLGSLGDPDSRIWIIGVWLLAYALWGLLNESPGDSLVDGLPSVDYLAPGPRLAIVSSGRFIF